MFSGKKIKQSRLIICFASGVFNNLIRSNSRISTFFWYRLRRILIYFFNDPCCEMDVFGSKLLMPLSHKLPLSLKSSSFFDSLPKRLSEYIYSKDKYIKCIDIGANIGDTIAAFNINKTDVFFLAIEPNSKFFGLLKKNWSNNNNIEFIKAICSSKNEEGSFKMDENSGTSFFVKSEDGNFQTTLTLDKIIEKTPFYSNVNILKIDTDGFDFEVLKGAFNSIKKSMPSILFECDIFSNVNYLNDSIETLCTFKTFGYKNFIVYDNFGYLMGKYSLEDLSGFKKLLFYQAISTFYYFDILVMKEEDINEFYMSELNFFIQSKSPKKVDLNFYTDF